MRVEGVQILLVEDNPGDARLMSEMLADAPMLRVDIVIATKVTDAIAELSNREFDVILLDLSLPDSHGLETVNRIKQTAFKVPIVVLTGNGDEELAIQAVNAGAQDYLSKNDVTAESIQRSIRYAIERKRSEWIDRERNNLQETLRSMDQVMGVVAHELRTPLTSMRMISEVLLTETRLEHERTEQFLKSIHSEVMRMSDMVSDILEAARIESGAAKWNWSLVRLEKICRDAVDVVAPMARRDVRVSYTVTPRGLMCNGDADALRRLLVNLLSNAAKHTRAGEITVDVEERSIDDERYIAMRVQDTGAGMPDEVTQKLGRAFALNTGVVGCAVGRGTGLGLAICKGIATAHGGSLSVASSPGKGSAFTALIRADLKHAVESSDEGTILREAAA